MVDKVKGENFSLINRLPDDDTMETALYGSAYPDVKAALFRLDKTVHILETRMSDNLAKLLEKPKADVERISAVMEISPYKEIAPDSPDKEIAAMLRRHVDIIAAIRWCGTHRRMVTMYGRLIGAQEQGIQLRESKEQVRIWRNAILQVAKEPLEFATLRDGYDF